MPKAFVIVGETDYSPGDVLAVLLDNEASRSLKQQCVEYDAKHPTPGAWGSSKWFEIRQAWRENHPLQKYGGQQVFDSYSMEEVELYES